MYLSPLVQTLGEAMLSQHCWPETQSLKFCSIFSIFYGCLFYPKLKTSLAVPYNASYWCLLHSSLPSQILIQCVSESEIFIITSTLSLVRGLFCLMILHIIDYWISLRGSGALGGYPAGQAPVWQPCLVQTPLKWAVRIFLLALSITKPNLVTLSAYLPSLFNLEFSFKGTCIQSRQISESARRICQSFLWSSRSAFHLASMKVQ